MTSPTAKRDNGKPNSARKTAIRESVAAVCFTCNLPVCFSRDTADKDAHKATLGHVVAEEIGGTWSVGNVASQCWACNWSAKRERVQDLTADAIADLLPARYLPTKSVTSDRRDCEPNADAARYGWAARKAARAARGLTW